MPTTKEPDDLPELHKRAAQEGGSLYVDTLNYQPNGLTELRKLAEIDLDLARAVVATNSEKDRRIDTSFRCGLAAATAVALTIIIGFVFVVVKLGWLQSIAFILLMLASSHLVRAVLTGEWSDTSWLRGLLGPRKKDE